MTEPWNLTEAQRRQFREAQIEAKRAKVPDFPDEIPAADTDDPAKSWRVMDASGNTVDYPGRRQARYAMDRERGSCAAYVRTDSDGEWVLYETLLRED